MNNKFHFSYRPDWVSVPAAFWVHVPVPGAPGEFLPLAPNELPHKGFVILHVEFESDVLFFSSMAQLDHYIEILSKKALPTTSQLSDSRGDRFGPNKHWLSRLPAAFKSPKKRPALVKTLLAAREFAIAEAPNNTFNPKS